jgi:hypothetical protein
VTEAFEEGYAERCEGGVTVVVKEIRGDMGEYRRGGRYILDHFGEEGKRGRERRD